MQSSNLPLPKTIDVPKENLHDLATISRLLVEEHLSNETTLALLVKHAQHALSFLSKHRSELWGSITHQEFDFDGFIESLKSKNLLTQEEINNLPHRVVSPSSEGSPVSSELKTASSQELSPLPPSNALTESELAAYNASRRPTAYEAIPERRNASFGNILKKVGFMKPSSKNNAQQPFQDPESKDFGKKC